MRGMLFFLAGALPLAVLVFLFASDFFVRWDGSVHAVRPGREGASRITVQIVDDDRTLERSWPADLVQDLVVPAPGSKQSSPATRKSRYTLHFLLKKGEEWVVTPTTSPQSFGLALLALGLLVAVRNMVTAGVPWRVAPVERAPLPVLPAPGAAAPQVRRSSSRQGPPPSRPQVGRGKR